MLLETTSPEFEDAVGLMADGFEVFCCSGSIATSERSQKTCTNFVAPFLVQLLYDCIEELFIYLY